MFNKCYIKWLPLNYGICFIVFRVSQTVCIRCDDVELTEQHILQASLIYLQNTWHKACHQFKWDQLCTPVATLFHVPTSISWPTQTLSNLQFKSLSVSTAFTIYFPPPCTSTWFQFKSRYVLHGAYIHLIHDKIVANSFFELLISAF